MSSIVIVSFPLHGHVTPMLGVAEHFVERGDQVRFITGARFAGRVAATGATFVALPAEADFDDQPLNERFPERAGLTGAAAIAFDIEQIFARPVEAQYDTLVSVLAAHPADVVLSEPVFGATALLLARRRPARPAVVMCGVVPLPIDSRDTAPYGMGLPPARVLNRPRNALLAMVNRRVQRRANDTLRSLYREVIGREATGNLMSWGRQADAIVQFSVPSFEYPLSDAPAGLCFAGPLSATGSRAPLPDWWADLDGPRPIIHVTQGTVANLDYRQVIQPTLEALAADDVLVVVATGGRPPDSLPPLPANARAAEYLPYDELLPRTAVYVTNGGYGGVQYALRYGVPVVATGGKEDKPEVGARVAWSGVGRRMRTEQPSPRALRRHILAVLRQPRYREASLRVAAEMATAGGFAALDDVVERAVAGTAAAGEG